MAKSRKTGDRARRAKSKQRTRRQQQTQKLNSHRRAVSVRIRISADDQKRANDHSERIDLGEYRVLASPVCTFGIVREEVEEEWPLREQLFYRCRYQVSLIIV